MDKKTSVERPQLNINFFVLQEFPDQSKQAVILKIYTEGNKKIARVPMYPQDINPIPPLFPIGQRGTKNNRTLFEIGSIDNAKRQVQEKGYIAIEIIDGVLQVEPEVEVDPQTIKAMKMIGLID